jgi:hypothetical protein
MWTRHQGLIVAIVAAVCLAVMAAPSVADEPSQPSQRERAETFAREGMESLMQALDLLLHSIPQYELPMMNENGDIIIRRRHESDPAKPAPAQPDADSTDT